MSIGHTRVLSHYLLNLINSSRTCNGKSKVVTIIAICGFLVLRKHVRKIVTGSYFVTVEDVSVNPQDLLLVYY